MPPPPTMVAISLFSIPRILFPFHRYVHLCHILDSTYKLCHMVFIFLWFTSLSMISCCLHVAANGIISFFFMTNIPSCKCSCCRSVAQSCLTLCSSLDCSTPGFPVLHRLPEIVQTHVHWTGDAIQPSHPLSRPSPPALNLSQHQGLFQWVCSLHKVVKVLELQLQHSLFNEYSGLISLGLTSLISLLSKGLSRVFSTTVWKHQFFGTQLSL